MASESPRIKNIPTEIIFVNYFYTNKANFKKFFESLKLKGTSEVIQTTT